VQEDLRNSCGDYQGISGVITFIDQRKLSFVSSLPNTGSMDCCVAKAYWRRPSDTHRSKGRQYLFMPSMAQPIRKTHMASSSYRPDKVLLTVVVFRVFESFLIAS
jgi:hypothetical protein